MTLGYQQAERSLLLAKTALSMKIDIQACQDYIAEQRDTYGRRLTIMMEANEDKKLQHAADDAVTDEFSVNGVTTSRMPAVARRA